MAVIAAFTFTDGTGEPTSIAVPINVIQPAGVVVYKGLVIAAPSSDDRSINPTIGSPTTG